MAYSTLCSSPAVSSVSRKIFANSPRPMVPLRAPEPPEPDAAAGGSTPEATSPGPLRDRLRGAETSGRSEPSPEQQRARGRLAPATGAVTRWTPTNSSCADSACPSTSRQSSIDSRIRSMRHRVRTPACDIHEGPATRAHPDRVPRPHRSSNSHRHRIARQEHATQREPAILGAALAALAPAGGPYGRTRPSPERQNRGRLRRRRKAVTLRKLGAQLSAQIQRWGP